MSGQPSPVKQAALLLLYPGFFKGPALGAMILLAAAAFLGLAGCDKPTEPRVCTAIAVDALVVTVVDASSGQRICDAKVLAVDGSFSEELRAFGSAQDCTYSGPTERAGLYEVLATRAGYEPARTTAARVTRDECHVIPVRVLVQMQRSTAAN
jgi:hypothetical protein